MVNSILLLYFVLVINIMNVPNQWNTPQERFERGQHNSNNKLAPA